MARVGRLHRRLSASSSSSTSPERGPDDDNDSFTMQANDSQSSLAVSLSNTDMMSEGFDEEEYQRRCQIPVYRLPAELLISIFSRISSTKDLQACMLVSKDWAKNSVGLLWHRPSMNRWASVHNVVKSIRKADKMFAYQDLVKRLNMSTLGSQVSDGTLMPLTVCKRIERLTLTSCSKVTDLSLTSLMDGNRNLVALDITGMESITDATLMTVADNCIRLQGLNITGCRKLTDDSVMAVARNCRHLKRLKFNSCTNLTDKSILTVAANSSHLLEIDLYDLPAVESPSVTHLLSSCRQLRELRLMRCPRITDSAFTSLSSKAAPFDSLRILDLTDCTEIGDKAVEKIVATCPRLRNLLLAKCRHLTDRAVFAITKLGKNLHYLHLGHCTRLTDEAIKGLARHCTRIRYIDLACCSNLTDASITMLASSLPKLKRVGLVKCAGITDRSIYALATYGGRMPNGTSKNGSVNVLERVHLSYCTSLTIEGIHVLLNNCPRLTHLSLTGVQAFLREDLTVFCREAPPEFTDHQRDVFCVFSGPGVIRLREHLNKIDSYLLPEADDGPRQRRPGVPAHRFFPQIANAQHPNPEEVMDEDLEDEGLAFDNEGDGANAAAMPRGMNAAAMAFVPGQGGATRFSFADMANFVNPRFVQARAAGGMVVTSIEGGRMVRGVLGGEELGRIPPPPPLSPLGPLEGRAREDWDEDEGGGVGVGGEQQVTGMMGAAALEDVED
ncbi:hypothetical protein CAC42_6401 [Sphaceloma murrayae]|uniref:Uncharacterized protein n=1 Tax=Sphaceloma murrayae TaxID=2082308 RepID=A0A2K1QMC0_9PEZI|nr:hypothetical protein CAC42_6401 [Sphaceloma murrayae]